ncbi:ferredoxin [Candidatus Poriferisocius sp.]|uniref:ferredoxin n=1 Tax=Candidatus Poriferisocius sp. TaxID=3101276 RepID=UPI003B5B7CE2
MRVTVDDDVCGGHGVCVALCPAVFAIDDAEGFAHVLVDAVADEDRGAVREAEMRCPSRAISVQEHS